MAVTNTGVVLRTITGVHDANFVHPLGDEEILNGDFSNWTNDNPDNWIVFNEDVNNYVTESLSGDKLRMVSDDTATLQIRQENIITAGVTYKIDVDVTEVISGSIRFQLNNQQQILNTVGLFTFYVTADVSGFFAITRQEACDVTIDNVSVKEVLVNRESTANNTGVVERSIVGVHDANFVHPLGDEEVVNGSFDADSDWVKGAGWSISEGNSIAVSGASTKLIQSISGLSGKFCKVSLTLSDYGGSGSVRIDFGSVSSDPINTNGEHTIYGTYDSNAFEVFKNASFSGSIDNISVKEVLVNRESTATNTGIVERPITGVNESDPMFPDNTISNIVNISGLISSLIADLKARATTFENEEATQEILINLQKC